MSLPTSTAPPVDEFVPSDQPAKQGPRVQRRVWLPIFLFVLTMASTFVAGATGWMPLGYVFEGLPPFGVVEKWDEAAINLRLTLLQQWQDGLLYMACLLLMLLAHEMGHFLMTLYYRIPASFPYFIPLPITPIGTLGAVIRMDSRDADRKQMFDIGIAGPLAGLVVAIPLLYIGIGRLDFTRAPAQPNINSGNFFKLGTPLGLRLMMQRQSPRGYEQLDAKQQTQVSILQVNPYFMAGWVGLLVTALNMMPVSQLDGGHITYCMFGRWAHWIARGFMVLTIAYMVFGGKYQLSLMIALILLIGIDHPPTSNDRAPLGIARYALGVASLAIPVLCLTLEPIIQ
jgi:membrane-associated protease RseP (regulator of RpoE activity)